MNSYQFSTYIIHRVLGKGAEGKVMLASPQGSSKKVAVKVIPKGSPSTSTQHTATGAAERLRDQYEMMQSVDHPNVMPRLGLVEDDKQLGMAMKYAKGGDLGKHIMNQGKLSLSKAKSIFKQLMEAVAHLHSKGIAHRDIKPENIVLNAKQDKIYLTDFGFIERFTNRQNNDDLTGHVSCCGTFNYSAPESLYGTQPVPTLPQSDIWSCGVVLALMVTGNLPFETPSQYETMRNIKRGKIHWPSMITSDRRLYDLMSRMLVVDPSKRMTASQVLAHEWLHINDDEPTSTAAPATVSRDSKSKEWVKQPPLPVGSGWTPRRRTTKRRVGLATIQE
jgi:serine/threonine protein kinase